LLFNVLFLVKNIPNIRYQDIIYILRQKLKLFFYYLKW